MHDELLSLRNLGKTSVQWLHASGIHTAADLRRLGAVSSYRAVKARGFGASKVLLRKMLSNASEDAVVTIFYGENMDEENANALVADVQADFPDAEFIVQNGGQPLYYYYFAVE